MTNIVLGLEAQLGPVPLDADDSSIKPVILAVALVVMLAGMWFLRDLVLMPINKIPSKDDIKPRTIIGSLMVFGAVCLIANSSAVASFIGTL